MTRSGGYICAIVGLCGASWLGARAARASECGELRAQAAALKAALGVEEGRKGAQAKDLASKLRAAEKGIPGACAPRRAGIVALPIGYLAVPPGAGARASFDPGDRWRLSLTTLAGASSGVVFAEPAAVELPRGIHWEGENKAGDLLIAVATDATVTVEEPAAGKGSWRIDVKRPPQLVPAAKLRECAAGKGDAGLKLSQASCEMVLRADPLGAGKGAVPERGRALPIGEWQYGGGSAVDIGDEELSEIASGGPPARLDLVLELSAAIPGFSDGKKLPVTLEANRAPSPAGAKLHLDNECFDAEACEQQRLVVEVHYDRIFGVPLLRAVAAPAVPVKVVGRVTDRLSRAVVGQRVAAQMGGRRAVTTTDRQGTFRFEALGAGELTYMAVGRKASARVRPEYTRTATVGAGENKLPPLLVDRLFE